MWQQACSDPNKLPERAMLLAQQMGSAALGGTSPLHSSKSNLVISDPIPGAQPLPVPPELAVFMGSGLGHPAVSFTCYFLFVFFFNYLPGIRISFHHGEGATASILMSTFWPAIKRHIRQTSSLTFKMALDNELFRVHILCWKAADRLD